MKNKSKFDIKPQALLTPEQSFNQLLGGSAENQIIEIPVDLIDEIEDQAFHINEEKVIEIAESMKIVGQLDPIIVAPSPDHEGRYLLIAGRHRKRACIENGLKTVKGYIKKESSNTKQEISLLLSNLSRNNDYKPSELAQAFSRLDELYRALGYNQTASRIAEANGTNRKSVHRYKALNKLHKSLLNLVDEGKLTVNTGYELSFLDQTEQNVIWIYLVNHPDYKLTTEIVQRIRHNDTPGVGIYDILNGGDRASVSNATEDGEKEKNRSTVKKPRKAEKKTEITVNETGFPMEQKFKMSDDQLTFIGEALYSLFQPLFAYIVKEFPSSYEVGKFLIKNYQYSDHTYSAETGDSCQFKFYSNLNHINLFLNGKKYFWELWQTEIDYICRYYLRNCISESEILGMFYNDGEGDHS